MPRQLFDHPVFVELFRDSTMKNAQPDRANGQIQMLALIGHQGNTGSRKMGTGATEPSITNQPGFSPIIQRSQGLPVKEGG